MVTLPIPRQLAKRVWLQRVRNFGYLPKWRVAALYAYFTGLMLFNLILLSLAGKPALNLLSILGCLLFAPIIAAFVLLATWISTRISLPFGIDDKGLILPAGRTLGLGFWHTTHCEVIADRHIPGAYYLCVFRKHRMLCRALLDDPDKAKPFLAEFERHYGKPAT